MPGIFFGILMFALVGIWIYRVYYSETPADKALSEALHRQQELKKQVQVAKVTKETDTLVESLASETNEIEEGKTNE